MVSNICGCSIIEIRCSNFYSVFPTPRKNYGIVTVRSLILSQIVCTINFYNEWFSAGRKTQKIAWKSRKAAEIQRKSHEIEFKKMTEEQRVVFKEAVKETIKKLFKLNDQKRKTAWVLKTSIKRKLLESQLLEIRKLQLNILINKKLEQFLK